MRLTLKRALQIAQEREGYQRCFRKDHGLGEVITYNGVTAPAKFIICPIIQFMPKPTYRFHSKKDFLISSEKAYKQQGWL
jgi:hypothetical protein